MSARASLAYHFQGVTSPNTTQVPDQYLDELLPILSGAELKVLLYITRRTFGFKKASDTISLSQMLNGITTKEGRVLDSGCGLSKKTLLGAIKRLERMGVIFREQRSSAERGHEPTVYFLNINGGYQPQNKEREPLAEKVPQGEGGKTPPSPRSNNSPTQHTVEQHTDFEYSKGEGKAEEGESADHEQRVHSPVKLHQTRSSGGLESVGETLTKRRPQTVASRNSIAAIEATIRQFADELGDKASLKSSLSRAMRMFEASALHTHVFIDALYLAKGEVLDRRRNPGKAPMPRNQMAYFFAVVEDRLGLKEEE